MSPMRPKKPCSAPGCPKLVDAGQRFCQRHQKAEHKRYNQNRPSARQQGYDGDWQRLRKWKLQRTPICEQCNRSAAVLVHHIEPIKARPDLRLTVNNLMSCCNHCHERLHDNRFKGSGT
jgi:5-methylcytosine-specific restriction enzyme A